MATEFKLPSLGENVDSGEVVRVLVKVGETVKADQSVIEMETGKATVEIPTSVGGVIKTIHVKEGAKAKVGQVIPTLEGGAAAPAARQRLIAERCAGSGTGARRQRPRSCRSRSRRSGESRRPA